MSDNLDTIDTIVDDMLNDGHTGPADSLEWVQTKLKFYAERIKEAWKRQCSQSWHHREMEELIWRHEKEVAELKKLIPQPDPDWKDICEKCHDGEIEPHYCEYHGEPNGCNSPIYGEYPTTEKSSAVGNAAAMHKALEKVYRIASTAKNDFDVFSGIERIWRISEWVLASPPRNCDVGTEREQGVRFNAFCKKDCDRCSACPKATKYGIETPCYLIWAQMPYETEQKGETNGSK